MTVFNQEPWPPERYKNRLVRIKADRMRDVRFGSTQIGILLSSGSVWSEVELENGDIVRVRKINHTDITLTAARRWLANRNKPKRARGTSRKRRNAIDPKHGEELALEISEGGGVD